MLFMLFLYNLLLLLASPFILLLTLWRCVHKPSFRAGVFERFGFIPRAKRVGAGPCVWMHAVSLGETLAARTIWQALLAALPDWQLVHSTSTETGQSEAVKAVGDRGQVIYMPYDFLLCTLLAFATVRPRLLVLLETELWPNLLLAARLTGCRVALVNGRISDRTLGGADRVSALYRWMMRQIDHFCMQSEEDARRIISIGADPDRVTVVGNAKFDQTLTRVSLGEQMTLRKTLALTREEPVVLAGSTHPGEEELVLRAFRQVKSLQPRVRLIIAPRQISRAQEIEALVAAHGFSAVRRSKLPGVPPPPDAVIILDTIGELARAYALCVASFVGGSLVPVGGHNILEPLALGKPAIFGPHMHNFRDIAQIALAANVGFQVDDVDTLAARWVELLNNPNRCREISEETVRVFRWHRGASTRCADEATHLVAPARVPTAL